MLAKRKGHRQDSWCTASAHPGQSGRTQCPRPVAAFEMAAGNIRHNCSTTSACRNQARAVVARAVDLGSGGQASWEDMRSCDYAHDQIHCSTTCDSMPVKMNAVAWCSACWLRSAGSQDPVGSWEEVEPTRDDRSTGSGPGREELELELEAAIAAVEANEQNDPEQAEQAAYAVVSRLRSACQ